MPINQHIAYKQTWYDDHLRWGCRLDNGMREAVVLFYQSKQGGQVST